MTEATSIPTSSSSPPGARRAALYYLAALLLGASLLLAVYVARPTGAAQPAVETSTSLDSSH